MNGDASDMPPAASLRLLFRSFSCQSSVRPTKLPWNTSRRPEGCRALFFFFLPSRANSDPWLGRCGIWEPQWQRVKPCVGDQCTDHQCGTATAFSLIFTLSSAADSGVSGILPTFLVSVRLGQPNHPRSCRSCPTREDWPVDSRVIDCHYSTCACRHRLPSDN